MKHILLIILIGLIFFIINYKIIRTNPNSNNTINSTARTNITESYINFSEDNSTKETANGIDYEYNKLADDVKLELDELYGLTDDNELLIKHNKNAKKYMLV